MKKILSLVFVFTLVFINSYAVKTAFDIYNEGYDFYVVNDYKAAVKSFKECIKMQPEFVKAYNKAGLAYIAMKQVDHALYMYKQAVYIDPKYSEAFYNYAIALSIKDEKSQKKQQELYEKVIELNNDDHIFVRASLNLAKIFRAEEKHDDAITILRNAVKKEPTFEELYNESGLCYLETGILDKAVESFSKAVELRHEYVEASTNLAIAYQKQGKLARAVTQLEDTLKKDKTFPGAQYSYGNALIASGYYDKAIEHLKQAIALDPKFAEAYYSLGKAYLHKNMFVEAEASFKLAMKNKKKYTLAKKMYDAVRQLQKDFRNHVTFPKLIIEGEEGDDEAAADLTDEQIAAAKKKAKEAENVEDLRLKDDKPKPVEGEETDGAVKNEDEEF